MRFMKLAIVINVLLISYLCYAADNDEKIFKNYKDCFLFIAKEQDLDKVEDSLFKLAAESTMRRMYINGQNNEMPLIIIESNYYNNMNNSIRGAQGNGDYYLFKVLKNGYEYVGKIGGNSYSCGTYNNYLRFITSWHMCAGENIESIYDWNGTSFTCTSNIRYKYNEDGSKMKVEDKRIN